MPNETPVLFITFARPDYARKSFDAIKHAAPKKLYFYNNKGREGFGDELERNNIVRSYTSEIDWDCEVKTFFRDEYVDIYTSLFSAIDWVFENEDKAIILEEDCVASITFFRFCENLLDKYENDNRIWMISGDNFTPLPENIRVSKPDYYYTKYSHIYGWASWKSRWAKIDRNMTTWEQAKKQKIFSLYFRNNKEAQYWENVFEKLYTQIEIKRIWDFLFVYARIINNALGIVPKQNLVTNIGVTGSHNKKGNSARSHNYPTFESDLEKVLISPDFVFCDEEFDKHHRKIHISPNFQKSLKSYLSVTVKLLLGSGIHSIIKRKLKN